MKHYKKYLQVILSFIISIFVISGCNSINTQNITKSDNNKSSKVENSSALFHYIDVNQGDSILIQINNKNILIDSGSKKYKSNLINYLEKQHINKFDYVIATHPHEDHIGNMSDVIKKYKIDKFYAPKVTSNTRTFKNMISALKSKNLKITVAKAGMCIDLGSNAKCEFIAPNSSKYKDINDYSVVAKITYGNSKFIFTGDAEALSEKEIIKNRFNVSCDVLKVGHHGSSSSSSKNFLDASKPSIAVISCGKNNDYGHPNKKTLTELTKRNIRIYRTDVDGTVVLSSDGNTIKKLN